MLFRWSLVSILLAIGAATKELVQQSHVPVLMWSHHLTPALHKYLAEFDNSMELPLSSLFEAIEDLFEECDSSAFIFINQPGLKKNDFIEYQKEFVNLEKYLRHSSTSIAFEMVELIPPDTFDRFSRHVQEHCRVDKIIYIDGSDSATFKPYIDIEKRIIHVECPPLPEESESRREAIYKFDSNLRKILAQIPSPAHSVIYTSLKPGKDSSDATGDIFPHIFSDKNRELPVERNHHKLNVPPSFNAYKPKFLGMKEEYLSIFDVQFIQENRQLLFLIATSLFGFIIFELISWHYTISVTDGTRRVKSIQSVKISHSDNNNIDFNRSSTS